MKKRRLDAEQLQAMYPPMPLALAASWRQTLSSLANRKEKPVMKRKLSLGLVLAVLLLLILLGTALALTQSDLLSHLFGGGPSIPQGLEGVLRQPEETVKAGDVTVALNEYVFDGEKLHLRWSVRNASGKQVMITMSPFLVNGRHMSVAHETPIQSDDHTWAYVLGGEADGAAMPLQIGDYTSFPNTPGREGNRPFVPGETAVITGEIYLWDIQSPPVLVDASAVAESGNYEAVAALRRLPVDKNGFCDLEAFCITGREDIGPFNAEASREAYAYLGWAQLRETVPIRFSLPLDTQPTRQAEPVQSTFEAGDFTLVISHFAYRQTGGTLELRVYAKPGAEVSYASSLYRDLVVLNGDTLAFLNGGRSYTIGSELVRGVERAYVSYEITLEAVSGEMPSAILIAPSVMKTGWDWEAEHDSRYDRNYGYDLKDAVRVELK